jgi:hypothetical protein
LWWAVLPDHRLSIQAEWKFQGMGESEVAAGIKAKDRELGIDRVAYTAADPSIQNQTGATHKDGTFLGQSIRDTLSHYGVHTVLADHDRFNGWSRCQALLRDAPDGDPWIAIDPSCRYLIRSIASARSDKNDPDDVDTKSDDHALDSWRYGAMSQPGPLAKQKTTRFAEGTFGALKQSVRRGRPVLGSESVRAAYA